MDATASRACSHRVAEAIASHPAGWRRTLAWTLAILTVTVCWVHTAGAQGEIVSDANTVVLDHLNGASAGTAAGTLGFATSLSGLGQAGVLAPVNYVRYSFAGFGQGTVEPWIRPSSLSGWAGLPDFNWNFFASYPSAGHILQLGISTTAGEVQGGFWPDGCAANSTAVPVGQWTHVALGWGPAGTKPYVTGTPAVGTPGGPSMVSTNYAYLNYWATLDPIGGHDVGT